MSADGVEAILRKLESLEHRLSCIERDHSEDMTAIGTRLEILTQAHRTCAARCWVGNQEQMRAVLKASSANLSAVEDSE